MKEAIQFEETPKINTFRGLNNRNKLQQQALRNKHTFKEEIYIDIDNSCLVINVVVGGEERGIVYYKYVYEGDCFFKNLNELYTDLIKEYERSKNNIDSDLTIPVVIQEIQGQSLPIDSVS